MFLEAAIGDAYGAAFEYVQPELIVTHNDLSRYYIHPKHGIGKGNYTDDTEMATAVAETMLEGVVPLPRESLAQWFVTVFNRSKRRGYAGRFYDFLCEVKDGEDFLTRIKPESDKSGAAMRGWVLGLYPNIGLVMSQSDLQARITHDTAGGIFSAQAAALMTHYFVYNRGPKIELPDFLSTYVPVVPWGRLRVEPVGPKGLDSVHAAVQAVVMHDSMSKILKQCVDFGGDVDTVATIALAAASWSQGIDQDLPQCLIDNLEDGQWGIDYLRDLDARLLSWSGLG